MHEAPEIAAEHAPAKPVPPARSVPAVRPRLSPRPDPPDFDALAERLGLSAQTAQLRAFLAAWLRDADAEVAGMLRYVLAGRPAFLRALTVLVCARAAD